jgi:urease alpha subunit
MAGTWEGSSGPRKPQLVLKGKTVIVEDIGCYDGSIPTTYRKVITYHFADKEKAMEYYYKKK